MSSLFQFTCTNMAHMILQENNMNNNEQEKN